MVRRFNFRLDRLLRYRRSLTQRERVTLAHRVGVLSSAELKSTQLKGYRNEIKIRQLHELESGTTAKDVINLNEHRQRIEEAIIESGKDIEKASEEVETQRGKLVEKRRDERAIELYRQRQWKDWMQEFNRDEARTLDDLATIRHTRPQDQ